MDKPLHVGLSQEEKGLASAVVYRFDACTFVLDLKHLVRREAGVPTALGGLKAAFQWIAQSAGPSPSPRM